MIGIGLGIGIGTTKSRIVVQDTFNRADSTTSIGTSNTAQLWTTLNGVWGISGNAAYMVTSGGDNRTSATINSQLSDCNVFVTISVWGGVSANPRIILRSTDVDNALMIEITSTSVTLYRLQAGAYTSLGNFARVPVNGDVFRLHLIGSTIKIYVNGTLELTVTSTFNQTATRHGVGASNVNASTSRFENFIVEAI